MEEGALVDLPKEGETLRNDVGAWSTQVVAVHEAATCGFPASAAPTEAVRRREQHLPAPDLGVG